MAAAHGARPTISDSGPGLQQLCRPSPAGRPGGASAGPPPEELNLQTSVWPAFQPAARPDLAGPPTPARPSQRGGAGGRRTREADADRALREEDAVAEARFRSARLGAAREAAWRRAWRDALQDGGVAAPPERPTRTTRTRGTGEAAAPPPAVLRLPPLPAPLPPCLQCALAGTCCSLTTTPYAQAFVDDRLAPRRPRPRPGAAVPFPSSWAAAYAALCAEMGPALPGEEARAAALPWRRQQLEQAFLRRAVVRGAADSPFLPRPPVRCARCARTGDPGCLQQSRDLTAAMAVVAAAAAAAGPPPPGVAWFASSGPPPLSLLPQHRMPLLDQIRGGPNRPDVRAAAAREAGAPPVLEAVFCRDPDALTAAQVAARAQELLEQIGQRGARAVGAGSRYAQPPGQGIPDPREEPSYLRALGAAGEPGTGAGARGPRLHIRPATRLEVARRVPRRSWLNVYAGRGVAVVVAAPAVTAAAAARHHPVRQRLPAPRASAYGAAAPPALPAWHANDRKPAAAAADGGPYWQRAHDVVPPLPAAAAATVDYTWQDYMLDVGLGRAALQLHRARRPAAAPPPPSPAPEQPGGARGPAPETDEQRHARLVQLAAALDAHFRERRRKVNAADAPSRPS